MSCNYVLGSLEGEEMNEDTFCLEQHMDDDSPLNLCAARGIILSIHPMLTLFMKCWGSYFRACWCGAHIWAAFLPADWRIVAIAHATEKNLQE